MINSANTPVDPAEIIYASGASESNNLAIKGIVQAARHMGGHIISTALEHSSVGGTLSALQWQNCEIDPVNIKQDGAISGYKRQGKGHSFLENYDA